MHSQIFVYCPFWLSISDYCTSANIIIMHIKLTRSLSYENRRRPDRGAPFHFQVDRTNINSRGTRYLDNENTVDSTCKYFDLNIKNQAISNKYVYNLDCSRFNGRPQCFKSWSFYCSQGSKTNSICKYLESIVHSSNSKKISFSIKSQAWKALNKFIQSYSGYFQKIQLHWRLK